jgi:hypothetical protein
MGVDYARAWEEAGWLPEGATAAPEDRCDVLVIVDRKSMLTDHYRDRFRNETGIAETRIGNVVVAKLVAGC